MFESAAKKRAIAIAFTIMAIGLDLVGPVLPSEPAWSWGVVRDLQPGLGFVMQGQAVLYTGAIPDDVCEGVDAVIEGNVVDGIFVAHTLSGPTCTKGFPCRRFECLPENERPHACRSGAPYFE